MISSELFSSIGEHYAMGLFEFEGDAPIVRYANALKRYWEKAIFPPYDGGMLYPCGVNSFNYDKNVAFRPHYANTYQLNDGLMKKKSAEAYEIVTKEMSLVKAFNVHTVGGMGWTHSFPNYERVLREGLNEYERRIDALPDGDFKRGMKILLEGIGIYHARCLSHLREVNAPKKLIQALENVPYKPATNIYEALVSLNFIYYVDGCDDIGPLDKLLIPYYNKENIVELIKELFRHVDENDGWLMNIIKHLAELKI